MAWLALRRSAGRTSPQAVTAICRALSAFLMRKFAGWIEASSTGVQVFKVYSLMLQTEVVSGADSSDVMLHRAYLNVSQVID